MSQTLPTTPTTKSGTAPRKPPGPRTLSPLGEGIALLRDPIGLTLEMWHRYGDVVRFRTPFGPTHLLLHPDHVKQVLQEKPRIYTKKLPNRQSIQPLFGDALPFANDGTTWRRQRRLMQPSFQHQRLAGFGQLMTEATVAMLERWQESMAGDAPLDISLEMIRLALRIVGQALFSLDLSNDAATVGHAFAKVAPLIAKYPLRPFPPLWVPTPSNRRLVTGLNTLNTIVYNLINERRKQMVDMDAPDLLGMLLSARDEETGLGMSDQQVRDEVIALLFGGHETTAMTLTWTWYLLSQYPEVERRLHAELDTVLAGQRPSLEHLEALPYTRMVIQEVMRLYPPIFGVTRFALSSDEIGGYALPANSIVTLIPYCTHRHPAFWEDPETFDPERFTPERSAGRPRLAYFPFGGGPRQCIGNHFAMMEAQLALATIAQRYSLRLVPGHQVEIKLLLTIQPRYGLPMTLHSR